MIVYAAFSELITLDLKSVQYLLYVEYFIIFRQLPTTILGHVYQFSFEQAADKRWMVEEVEKRNRI